MKNVVMVLAGAIILLGTGLNPFSQNSVLSEGSWFKISVEETGIHKITYNDLVGWGIDPAQVNPQNIRLYGNGNGMLPELNDEFRYEDLQENAIHVFGEEDGSFDPEDYILFYGEGPTEWNMDSETGLFVHETNLYTTHSCYFLNYDMGAGKRIESQASSTLTENGLSGSFDDYYAHELEEENLIHTGKNWYGEEFDENISYDFEILFPNLILGEQLSFKANAAARADAISSMDFQVNNIAILQFSFPGINTQNYNGDYAREKQGVTFFSSTDELLNINVTYQQPNDSSKAWLNYFEINARCKLVIDQGQLSFRDKLNSMPGDIIKFKIYTENENLSVWNVTDPMNINRQEYELDTDGIFYKTEVGGIEEFIVFDESEYLSADFVGTVENQNLHALQPVDLIIITHEDFLSQAEELALLHQTTQGISVEIIELQKIYNEFSSGVQDVTAIRDFIKYIYEKQLTPSHMNVLLFGNASFDYLDRIENNTNFIPVWESVESLNPVNSYCGDDYFGIFDDGGQLEIGFGRLPVESPEEANVIVDKIINYCTNQAFTSSWRNEISFIADDEDGGLHFEQVEDIAELVVSLNPSVNIKKIYLDAFEQIQSPEGDRYPEVNAEITSKINSGVNIINYTGHGSPSAWAHEQVFTETDVESWENNNSLPMVFAATADFGRFDDPDINSLSNKVMLIENAGASSVLSASRATYAGSNTILHENFYKILLTYPEFSLGEVIREIKNLSGLSSNTRKFNLLGDPALRLSIPLNNVETEAINGIAAEEFNDTIHPGEQIVISGFISDINNEPLYSFSGNLKIKVLDIIRTGSTLGNDPGSPVKEFNVQDSIIYELETEIINGQFVFSFNFPNNSYPEIGNIILSYYANDELVDAVGNYNGIAVGGLAGNNPAYLAESDFIKFYPTIVSDKVNFKIESDTPDLDIGIYNLQGVCVKQLSFIDYQKGNEGYFDISEFNNGMYIIKAISESGAKSFKFLKQ